MTKRKAGTVYDTRPLSLKGFAALAKELGVDEGEAKARWETVDLDGDERKSIDDKFGLGYAGGGGVGEPEYRRGMAKLKG